MGIGMSVSSQPLLKPEVRLRSFRASNILVGTMVIAILYLLQRTSIVFRFRPHSPWLQRV